MNKADAVKWYGTGAELARAVGISRQAVNKWPAIIPKGSAMDLADITKGEKRNGVRLTYDRAVYRRTRHGKAD